MDTPLPPCIDMAALAAFNPDLASQALAQLYLDGNLSLALEWASRLDPFKSLSALPQPRPLDSELPPGLPASHASALPSMASRYGSMVDFALAARDIQTLDALASTPGFSKTLFTDRFDLVARIAAGDLRAHPAFAEYLFDRLSPNPKDKASPARYGDSGIVLLAEAAVKHGRFDWIARLNAFRLSTEHEPLQGSHLISHHLSEPRCLAGAQALLDAGCVLPIYWLEISRAFIISDEPGHQNFALRLLALDLNQRLELSKKPCVFAQQHPTLSQILSHSALFPEPTKTPLAWLGFYLSQGLEPFLPARDGSPALATVLLGSNWRDAARRLHSGSPASARHERLVVDENASGLLYAMLATSTSGVDERLDIQCFGSELRSSFFGARKIDLLCACIGQGFYQCADVLIAHGADWRFAAKQCDQWLRRADSLDSPEALEAAKAYCDALSLRHVSLKSTQRRDSRLATNDAPLAPVLRARRL